MNCEQFKNNFLLKVGELSPDSEEKAHLESCPDCAGYYDNLAALEGKLASQKINLLTADEYAALKDKLDSDIEREGNRAINHYPTYIRYGASLAAVLILVFFSFFQHLRVPEIRPLSADSLLAALQATDSAQESDSEEIDKPYLDVVINNYVQDYGFNSSEMLIGDLSEKELEYLKSKMKAGDIL